MSALPHCLTFRKPIDFGTFLVLFILLIECLRYAFATNTPAHTHIFHSPLKGGKQHKP